METRWPRREDDDDVDGSSRQGGKRDGGRSEGVEQDREINLRGEGPEGKGRKKAKFRHRTLCVWGKKGCSLCLLCLLAGWLQMMMMMMMEMMMQSCRGNEKENEDGEC